jgi:peptidoglycan hydrolase-like protein with peptidoglycan-binding domain
MSVIKGCFGTFFGLVLFFIGLPVTLIIFGLVYSDGRMAPNHNASPAKTAPAPEFQTLSNENIKRIQVALKEKGYNPGPADGAFVKQTAEAIRDFEKDSGLITSGEPSVRIMIMLGLDPSNP